MMLQWDTWTLSDVSVKLRVFGCRCFSFMELDVMHTLGLLLVLFLAIMGTIIYNMNIMLFFKTRI